MVASAPGHGTADAGVERATAVMHEIDAKWRDSAQRTGGIVVGFLRGLIHHYRRQWYVRTACVAVCLCLCLCLWLGVWDRGVVVRWAWCCC